MRATKKNKRQALPRGLTPQEATRRFKVGLVTEFRQTTHIREQMVNPKRDFDMGDVRHVARLGAVRRPGEYSIKYGSYAYVIEGHDVEGGALNIVFSVGRDHVKLITGVRP